MQRREHSRTALLCAADVHALTLFFLCSLPHQAGGCLPLIPRRTGVRLTCSVWYELRSIRMQSRSFAVPASRQQESRPRCAPYTTVPLQQAHGIGLCFWYEAQSGQLCCCSEGSTAELHCCALLMCRHSRCFSFVHRHNRQESVCFCCRDAQEVSSLVPASRQQESRPRCAPCSTSAHPVPEGTSSPDTMCTVAQQAKLLHRINRRSLFLTVQASIR